MRSHVRIQAFVAILVFFSLSSICLEAACAQDGYVRRWKSGNFTVEAMLVSHDEDEVKLKTPKRVVTVAIDKLSEEDQKYVAGLKIIEADRKQHETVMPHMERYTESPMAVAEILDRVGKDHPDSPYANMMVGLALASERANYQAAKKYFSTAVRIINKHQRILGEGFHAHTLVSLENNLAICKLKSGNGDEASKHFAAGGKNEIPFALYHNATLLMEATNSPSTQIRFRPKSRDALVGILAKKKPATPGVKVPQMYLFSLEWDEPLDRRSLSRLVSLKGEALPRSEEKSNYLGGGVYNTEEDLIKRGYSEFAAASGVLISPTLLLTNRHVVQSRENNLSYTFTRFLEDGSPELIGGKVVKWSVVREENLALIELDKPVEGVDPIPLRQRELEREEKLTVFGFPHVFDNGEHLEATSGNYLGGDRDYPWIYSSNLMEDGVGGGPCLDMNGNLVGLAFAKKDFSYGRMNWLMNPGRRNPEIRRRRSNNETVVISNEAVSEFMKFADPNFDFGEEANDEFANRHALSSRVRGAVMLVKSWKAEAAGKGRPARDLVEVAVVGKRGDPLAKLASIRKERLFPDVWCMSCYGTGKWKCPTCVGRGDVTVRGLVETGRNDVHGNKMLRHGLKEVDCPDCTVPISDCRHCSGGKLPFR
jgi:S1-C subfamily serine protease